MTTGSMTLLLLLWSLGPSCSPTLDWLVGCQAHVLRLSACEELVDWACFIPREPRP